MNDATPLHKKSTQEGRILAHLLIGSITPIDALELYGCFRLAARIHTLRQRGYTILVTNVQSLRNPHVIYGRYYMTPAERQRVLNLEVAQ
jgi:hypothetical protein